MPPKGLPRTKVIRFRIHQGELDLFVSAAARVSLNLHDWARSSLMRTANSDLLDYRENPGNPPIKPPKP